MARRARQETVTEEGGFFHVLNRVGGSRDYFPFRQKRVGRHFVSWLRHCLSRSCIKAVAYTLMGNHFHLILKVERFRKLERSELEHFAAIRWGRLWRIRTRLWSLERWQRFNRDLFSLDVFMRDFQGRFATWFNKLFNRRGHLWADRYTAIKLEGLVAIKECLFYIELNPVRAGLKPLPEHWKHGSAYLRYKGLDDELIPLSELFPQISLNRVWSEYRAGLLYRGLHPTKANQAAIPEEILSGEHAEPFSRPGVYLKRQRFLTDGLILGAAEVISSHLKRLRKAGRYHRRRHPIPQLGGLLFTLREQRLTA